LILTKLIIIRLKLMNLLAVGKNELLGIEESPNLTEKQKLRIDLIISDRPWQITDTGFIDKIEQIGFIKKTVKEEQFESIKEIFRHKFHKESIVTACIAVYRDILILKRKKEIVGMVKICFFCAKNQITGTNADTLDFGQSGDYGKLAKILNG